MIYHSTLYLSICHYIPIQKHSVQNQINILLLTIIQNFTSLYLNMIYHINPTQNTLPHNTQIARLISIISKAVMPALLVLIIP